MDRTIRIVGLVLRAPFFAVWVLWLALMSLVDAVVTGLWYFIVLPVLFGLIKVPVRFLYVAFKNTGREELGDELAENVYTWKEGLRRFPERFKRRWPDAWNWFITAGQ